MNKLNIVIISRHILPQLSPRASRATELAKEMSRQGHFVKLYAILGNYDYKIFEKEHNLEVQNLGKMRFAKWTSDGNVNYSIINRIAIKLFKRHMDFPDIELMFKASRLIKKQKNIDLLITIAQPFTIHWGVALAKTKKNLHFPKAWIADCGDPYMGSAFETHPFYFKYVEKWFCKKVDYLTVPIREARKGYYKEFRDKIHIIPQGFKFDEVVLPTKKPSNKVPIFIYAGTFFKDGRDPSLLLEYLASIKEPFKFIIYTKSKSFVTPFINKLENRLFLKDYIPRGRLLQLMNQADFLINFDNGTDIHSPSKLIDYAIVKRPVLNLKGQCFDKNLIHDFLKGNYSKKLKIENIEQYKIENVTTKFLELYKNILALKL